MGNKTSSDRSTHTDLDSSIDSEDMDIEPNNDSDIINLYVEKSLLNFQNTALDKKQLYEIKGQTFADVEAPIIDKYLEFEMYVRKMEAQNFFKMDDSPDKYCELPEDEEEFQASAQPNASTFRISIQKVSRGVIINSKIYITDHNWNTMVFLDPNNVNCIVCDTCLTLFKCPAHMVEEKHEKNLYMYEPLKEFELNIVRKIRNNYHCGICNELLDIKDINNHLDSKTHGDNLLFAYNKACDVIFDSDIFDNGNRNNDCYHFNANRINDNDTTNDWTVNDWIDNLSNTHSDDYTEYTTNSESVDFDYEYDFTDYESNELPLPGVSYASMARKPKPYDNPKFLLITAGKKKYKIPFDWWHMILVNKNNTFYCMACKLQEHVKVKSKHCSEGQHVETLNSYKIMKRFNNHLVREVDRLYHCAHCNHLQLPHDMENHLNRKHPVKDALYETSTALNIVNDNETANVNNDKPNDAGNRNNDKAIIKENAGGNKNNDKTVDVKNNEEYSKVLAYFNTNVGVYAFGPRINVLLMAYHVICVKDDHFYCGLCVVTHNAKAIVQHILDIKHIRLLQLHQFLPQFGNHLIRHIHGAFHCAICNMPIQQNYIVIHIQHPFHIGLLSNALTPIVQNPSLPPLLPKLNENPVFKESRMIKKTEPKETKAIAKTEIMQETGLMKQEKTETIKIPEYTKLMQVETKVMHEETGLMKKEKVKNDDMELDNSFETPEALFDLESHVYVKFQGYFKVTATCYHTLVAIGNGNRHCFICNVTNLEHEDLKKHVDSREHEKNLNDYKFLDKYGENLIRQSYVLYHCGICNVILRYSELSKHFEWQPHIKALKKMNNVMKKQRKTQVQSGEIKMFIIKTQKEDIFLDVKEPEIKILYSAVIKGNKTVEKKKLFLVNDRMLKIKFESWHGVAATKNGFKCIVCQIEFKKDVMLHVTEEGHERNLEREFLKEYSPCLIREINRESVNCVICNIELSSKMDVIIEHMGGKKHKKNYDIILKYSSEASTYEDCCGDVITV